MMGHLNGCMLLGFRNENKNETLELFDWFEPRRRKNKEIENNYYSGPVSNVNLFAGGQFFARSIRTSFNNSIVRFSDV